MSDGRLSARGTAAHLDYRRAGGVLVANEAASTIVPEPGSGLSAYGLLHVSAPRAEGEIGTRRADGTGGVRLDTARGDRADTESVHYDGKTVRSDSRVRANGPGYVVESRGLVAQADGSSVQLTGGVTGRLEPEVQR